MREHLERALRTAAAVVAAMVCTVSPAQAAFYSGAWDPLYGAPYLDGNTVFGYPLGWRGAVDVFVPDDCVPASGLIRYDAANPCEGDGSEGEGFVPKVKSAAVTFFKWDNDDIDGNEEVTGTLTFAESSIAIRALNFDGPELISLFTLPSNWDEPTWKPSGGPLPSATSPFFSLLFVDAAASDCLTAIFGCIFDTEFPVDVDLSGGKVPPDYFGPLLLSHPTRGFNDPLTFMNFLSTIAAATQISVSDVGSEEGEPRFPNGRLFAAAPTEVPEPGSLALVALALFATAWVARRRRRT